MKEMILQDVKDISLDILQHVHDFCINNDIQYSIAYGTLIGAIRHAGFIPWDDDIDIVMTRPNFEKFCSLYYESEEYELIKPFSDESYIAFGRVCDKKRTIVEDEFFPWSRSRHGLWIDIFPLDSVPDSMIDFCKFIERAERAWSKANLARSAKISMKAHLPMVKKIKLIIKKIFFNFSQPTTFQRKIFCKTTDFNNSNFYGNISFMRYKYKERYNKEWFNNYTNIEFEGRMFLCIKKYDEYLRSIYGDYMKLPPIEQQIPLHSFHKNYWK